MSKAAFLPLFLAWVFCFVVWDVLYQSPDLLEQTKRQQKENNWVVAPHAFHLCQMENKAI